MTAALEGDERSASRPGRNLPPWKIRYPLYRRLGGLLGRSGRAENLVPTAIRSRTVQPIVSHYTDWATRLTMKRVAYTKTHSSVKRHFSFHIRTVQHLDIIKVLFIHQLMHQWVVLKTILKFTLEFTLKQLRHVSVLQIHHHQGTH
jgi:hypothetical protein